MKLFAITSTRNNLERYGKNATKNLEFHIQHDTDTEECFQYVIKEVNKSSLRLECNQKQNRRLEEALGKKRVTRCTGKVSVRPKNNVCIKQAGSRKRKDRKNERLKYKVTWTDGTIGYGHLPMDMEIYMEIPTSSTFVYRSST